MPQLTPYHLTFRSGLHVGAGVENLNETLAYIPSDTLFSALVETERLSGRDAASFLQPFLDGDPPFWLTSAFPFAGEVRFYPMPADLRTIFSPALLSNFEWNKPLKKLHYFSEGLLRLALKNRDPLDEYLLQPEKRVTLQSGAAWLLADEISGLPEEMRTYREKGKEGRKPLSSQALHDQKIWKTQAVPRVSVDRVSSTSTLYQAERVLFAGECGLWFGAVGQIDNLSYLLTMLGESGLGGERTAGYGAFTFQPRDLVTLADPAPEGMTYLLSRLAPRPGEVKALQHEHAAYRMVSVSGYLRTLDGAAQRRKRLWLLAEGSLLPGKPLGELKDVTPEYDAKAGELPHRVYRAGLALTLGWPRPPILQEVTHA